MGRRKWAILWMLSWLAATWAESPRRIDATHSGARLRDLGEIRGNQVTLVVELAELCLPATCFSTRTYNGTVPGPTIVTHPGSVLEVTIINALGPEDNAKVSPRRDKHFQKPNSTNVHPHGLHVSPWEDDIGVLVEPGERHTFRYTLPPDHAGGLAWYHPHGEGSSTMQTAGGMFGALLVEDAVVPKAVEEILLTVQNCPFEGELSIKDMQYTDDERATDPEFTWRFNRAVSQPWPSWTGSVVLVNGRVRPKIRLEPRRWYRLRVLTASTFKTFHTTVSEHCEWHLLAKDGVYLADAPRPFGVLPLWPGARADLLLRCEPGQHDWAGGADGSVLGTYSRTAHWYVRNPGVIATFDVAKESSNRSDEFPLLATLRRRFAALGRPHYLANLGTAQPLVRASLVFDSQNRINGLTYSPSKPLLSIPVRRPVEYNIRGIAEHPVHFHTSPFQLVRGVNVSFPSHREHRDAGFMRLGDWHDTLLLYTRAALVRQLPDFLGPMRVHCHVFQHSDYGMMATINVSE